MLNNHILNTLKFFDLCSFPLTGPEIWQYLPFKGDFEGVRCALQVLEAQGLVGQNRGFYHLPGRAELVDEREKRLTNAMAIKYPRVRLVSKLLARLPWIKLICLVGQKGSHNLRPTGDLDFFIVCQPSKIWLTRFFSAGLIKILGLRPTARNRQDKICLSFFVDNNNLNLQKFLLPENNLIDWVFIYYLANFAPVLDRDNTFNKLIAANNWLKNYLPNFSWPENFDYLKITAKPWPIFKLCNNCEQQVKKIQLNVLPPELKEKMNVSTEVVVNDGVLKLHSNDKRKEFLARHSRAGGNPPPPNNY